MSFRCRCGECAGGLTLDEQWYVDNVPDDQEEQPDDETPERKEQ